MSFPALIGAATAFLLELRYRQEERNTREVGECNRLIFTLTQMLSVLEDFQELLFDQSRKTLGREPEWHEIGALPGAPMKGPELVIGEYTFLLEDRCKKGHALKVLGRVYVAASRFNSALALVHERTSLVDRYRSQRATSQFGRGAEAAPGLIEAEATGQRVQQLTQMLTADLPEAIGVFKEVIGELRETLSARYPGRQFISPRPIDGGTAPP